MKVTVNDLELAESAYVDIETQNITFKAGEGVHVVDAIDAITIRVDDRRVLLWEVFEIEGERRCAKEEECP